MNINLNPDRYDPATVENWHAMPYPRGHLCCSNGVLALMDQEPLELFTEQTVAIMKAFTNAVETKQMTGSKGFFTVELPQASGMPKSIKIHARIHATYGLTACICLIADGESNSLL